MPVYKKIDTGNGTYLGVWKLTEELDELEAMVLLNDDEQAVYSQFRFEGRKREWLAVRALIREMRGCYTPVSYLPSGKPLIDGGFISISHTKGYVCVTLSDKPTAVDIEYLSNRADRYFQRFVSSDELEFIDSQQFSLYVLLIWSAKEMLFKLFDRQGVIFNSDLFVKSFKVEKSGDFTGGISQEGFNAEVKMSYWVTDDFVLVYC